MRYQRGGSFLEILIALLVFMCSAMAIFTQQWQISRAMHVMQSDLRELWERDTQYERTVNVQKTNVSS